MTTTSRITLALPSIILAAFLSLQPTFAAGADALAAVKSQADLDALVASTSTLAVATMLMRAS